MADTFQLNLGSLRSSVNLTLHTHHASRLWFGRQRSDNKPGMIGLSGFSNIINRISAGAAKDDPYSDLFLIIIEDKIEEAEQQLTAIDERLDQVMAMLPKQLDVGTNLSIQPLKLPLYLNSPLAFKGVYLLTRYDELVRRILLAAHIGLIDNGSKEAWLDEGAAVLRRLYGVGQRYKGYSGASRDDIAANNARAINAQQMYSFLEMPKDVLEGTRRSKFAPAIQRPGDAPATSSGGDDGFDGDSADEDEHLDAMASAHPVTEMSEA
ncbi:MAG: integrating conjugative element protein [Pseudomonas sp. PGPPP4]|jgi:integrating conjugative element protein (TIGR03761 family)|uniref:PFL_4669 family integrating conjugative element protein n=1 Tax=Pseudomonas TaxID=286 RepID=UPI0005C97D98|nr:MULTISPECIES: TIGR03761 family integrating conjugative element protein [Pseudomonas]KIZ52725.1 conjugal transfer protein [Pseudomonas oryzihabitans]OYT79110.1 MAG: integrating conjugative element protein [Pseudomonas sp. PGPPP4]